MLAPSESLAEATFDAVMSGALEHASKGSTLGLSAVATLRAAADRSLAGLTATVPAASAR